MATFPIYPWLYVYLFYENQLLLLFMCLKICVKCSGHDLVFFHTWHIRHRSDLPPISARLARWWKAIERAISLWSWHRCWETNFDQHFGQKLPRTWGWCIYLAIYLLVLCCTCFGSHRQEVANIWFPCCESKVSLGLEFWFLLLLFWWYFPN